MEHRVIREFTREYLITNFPRARTAPFSFPFAPREENRRCFEDGCIIFSPGFTTNSLLNRDDYACCSIVKRQKLVGIVYCEPRATEKIDEFSLFIYPILMESDAVEGRRIHPSVDIDRDTQRFMPINGWLIFQDREDREIHIYFRFNLSRFEI